MIATLLGMWNCGLLLAAVIAHQKKVDWTYWRFTALLLLVAAVVVMYGLVGVLALVLFAIMAWQAVKVRNTHCLPFSK